MTACHSQFAFTTLSTPPYSHIAYRHPASPKSWPHPESETVLHAIVHLPLLLLLGEPQWAHCFLECSQMRPFLCLLTSPSCLFWCHTFWPFGFFGPDISAQSLCLRFPEPPPLSATAPDVAWLMRSELSEQKIWFVTPRLLIFKSSIWNICQMCLSDISV